MARILLTSEVGYAQIDETAQRLGWSLVNIYARRDGRPRQRMFVDRAGATLITFVEDHRIAAHYVVLAGHDVGPTEIDLRAALVSISTEQALRLLDDPSTRARGVCWLGVLAPELPGEPFEEVFRSAATSEIKILRDAAAFAYEAAGWPSDG